MEQRRILGNERAILKQNSDQHPSRFMKRLEGPREGYRRLGRRVVHSASAKGVLDSSAVNFLDDDPGRNAMQNVRKNPRRSGRRAHNGKIVERVVGFDDRVYYYRFRLDESEEHPHSQIA